MRDEFLPNCYLYLHRTPIDITTANPIQSITRRPRQIHTVLVRNGKRSVTPSTTSSLEIKNKNRRTLNFTSRVELTNRQGRKKKSSTKRKKQKQEKKSFAQGLPLAGLPATLLLHALVKLAPGFHHLLASSGSRPRFYGHSSSATLSLVGDFVASRETAHYFEHSIRVIQEGVYVCICLLLSTTRYSLYVRVFAFTISEAQLRLRSHTIQPFIMRIP